MKEHVWDKKKKQANTLIYRLLSVIIRHKSCNPVLISALFYLSLTQTGAAEYCLKSVTKRTFSWNTNK